jgi:serine/threonine protein kinase
MRKLVAVKKISNPLNDSDVLAQGVYREITLLANCQGNETILSFYDLYLTEKDIYLIFEFMESDLELAIQSGILKNINICFIMF